jgi:ubiquinone/menaquinone biosynthesis C-methylase UbiE
MSNWNALAELDPLWTILSEPEKKFGKWDAAEFFNTGNPEAQRVLEMCKSNAVDVSFGRMLDFGCGVGRMTRAFSAYFQGCVGVDVSEKMIILAKQYNSQVPHCEFIASEAARLPVPDATFDFVFTVLVLQHLPTRASIRNYISEFIRVAKDGGVIAFQLPVAVPLIRRIQPKRRLWAVLAALGVPSSWLFRQGLAPIQINGIPRKEVERFLRAQGAEVRVVEKYRTGAAAEDPCHSYYYVAVRKPRAPAVRSPAG